MPCNCGRGRKPKTRADLKSATKPVRVVPKVRQVAKPADNQRKTCPQCGWMMGRTRYIDVNTKKLIVNFACPNRKCPRYNK